MIDVFISHHTNSSIHIVEEIVRKLEENGIKCWYAPRDTAGDYAGSIVRAIKECRAFVLVLNRDASESPHVLNELNVVTQRLTHKELVDIIPFHIADETISDEANYYIGRMNWINAMVPPIEARINELVNKILLTVLAKEESMYLLRRSTDEKILLREGQFCIGTNKQECLYYVQGNQYISKIHACINKKGNDVYFTDMRSNNYSYVNGIVVEPKVSIQIKGGDIIKLANEEFIVVKDE